VKKIVVVLMLVAAIAFVAAGWECGTIKLESKSILHYYCGTKVGVGGDLSWDEIDILLEMAGPHGPPYIIRINNPDTVEELWIGGEFVDVMARRLDVVEVLEAQEEMRYWTRRAIRATFIVGAVLGALLMFLVGGE